eukprot:scaffold61872_cov61-Phaeocystis_antarctica.AAC.3
MNTVRRCTLEFVSPPRSPSFKKTHSHTQICERARERERHLETTRARVRTAHSCFLPARAATILASALASACWCVSRRWSSSAHAAPGPSSRLAASAATASAGAVEARCSSRPRKSTPASIVMKATAGVASAQSAVQAAPSEHACERVGVAECLGTGGGLLGDESSCRGELVEGHGDCGRRDEVEEERQQRDGRPAQQPCADGPRTAGGIEREERHGERDEGGRERDRRVGARRADGAVALAVPRGGQPQGREDHRDAEELSQQTEQRRPADETAGAGASGLGVPKH